MSADVLAVLLAAVYAAVYAFGYWHGKADKRGNYENRRYRAR